MKITLDNTPERLEAIRALGSKNVKLSEDAQYAFAAFITPVVQQVLLEAGSSSMVYRNLFFDEDDSPSIPLDLYYGEDLDYITCWSQTWGGGVPTNHVGGLRELKIATFNLTTAVSTYKKYARKARLDVISKLLERATNEMLVKWERNGWAVFLMALAEASTQSQQHVIRAGTAGVFQVDDLNKLFTLSRRLNAAYTGGTPMDYQSKGLTDIFVSPEIKEQIRGFAYQPMNTRLGPTAVGATVANYTGTTAVPLPDSVRAEIFNSAGTSEIYGVAIHELLELGVGRVYNTLFDQFAGATSYAKLDGTGGAVFNGATEQLVVGVDNSRDFAVRALAKDEAGSIVNWQVDDAFLKRGDRFGWFTETNCGFSILDSRPLIGLIC